MPEQAGGRTVGERFDPIPRVLHQTWKSREPPAEWRAYRRTWWEHHPAWRFVLWTDADNRRLIAERYDWFLQVYDAFPRAIQRVDAAKLFILHSQGGVYADLDCECLRPVEPLLERGGAVVSRTPDGVIDGAFLASPAAHPLWEEGFEEMCRPPLVARFFRRVPGFHASYVLFSTGPQMLKRAVRRYEGKLDRARRGAGVTVYPPGLLSSRSWLRRREPLPDRGAFLCHHYSDSWLTPLELAISDLLTAHRLMVALLVLAAVCCLAVLAAVL